MEICAEHAETAEGVAPPPPQLLLHNGWTHRLRSDFRIRIRSKQFVLNEPGYNKNQLSRLLYVSDLVFDNEKTI